MAFPQGNVFGRMGAPVTDALRRAALAGDQKLLRRAVNAALTQAANGSLAHLAWIADRLEGKALARVETTATDARGLDLQTVVQAVLAARSAHADDAHVVSTGLVESLESAQSAVSEDSAASLPAPGASSADPPVP